MVMIRLPSAMTFPSSVKKRTVSPRVRNIKTLNSAEKPACIHSPVWMTE